MKTHLFVLVVVPDDHGRYLLVQERDGSWYLPAGKVEPAENLMAAAVRETAEEAGVMVSLCGLLGVDHTWAQGHGRLRFCFVGSQALSCDPKSTADAHTLGARYVHRSNIADLPLRHAEVQDWIARYEQATTLLPCEAYGWRGPSGPSLRNPRHR